MWSSVRFSAPFAHRLASTGSKAEVQQSQQPAPNSGAAIAAAQAVQQGGLLPDVAGAVEAVREVPTSSARPAGCTHAVAAPGVPSATVAPTLISQSAAAPARRGHPAISTYYDRWRATHGKTPTITPKKVGILTRIYKGLGPEAPDEYPRLLDALFRSDDRFILENAHSPEVFETKLDTLRVNDNGHGKTQGTNKKWAGRTVREIGR
jgi:hypothetical protein